MQKAKAFIFLVVGILVFFIALVVLYNNKQFAKHALQTKAVAIETASGPNHPTIKIILPNNTYDTLPLNGMIKGYHVGDTAHVLYIDDGISTKVEENSFKGLYSFGLIFLGMGILFMGIAIFALKTKKKVFN